MEDMGADPARERGTCAHPAIGVAGQDPVGDGEGPVRDAAQPVRLLPLDHRRPGALRRARREPRPRWPATWARPRRTPELLVHHAQPLRRRPRRDRARTAAPGGLTAADAFLRTWVPRIVDSPAFRRTACSSITFDEAESSDSTACCNEQTGPNTPSPGGPEPGPGGGRIGAVVLSPYTRAGARRRSPTTTTRSCAASRTSSASSTSATPGRTASSPSAPTSTPTPPAPRHRW